MPAHSRTDSLYFTVTVFVTVGFGDITATSQTARLIVTAQMILDLIVLGLGMPGQLLGWDRVTDPVAGVDERALMHVEGMEELSQGCGVGEVCRTSWEFGLAANGCAPGVTGRVPIVQGDLTEHQVRAGGEGAVLETGRSSPVARASIR